MQNTKELNTIQLQQITGGGNVKQCGAGILGGVIAGSTGGQSVNFLELLEEVLLQGAYQNNIYSNLV